MTGSARSAATRMPLTDFRRRDHAQGSALRLRVPDRHLAAGTRRGRRRARLQPAARAARPLRKAGDRRIPAIRAADAGRPRRRRRSTPFIDEHARRHPQAARRHGRQPDLPRPARRPEPQRDHRDADPRRRAHHHGAALSARKSSPATSASCSSPASRCPTAWRASRRPAKRAATSPPAAPASRRR